MIFNEVDECLVQETILKQKKEDFRICKIINIIFYTSIMTLILFVCLLNLYHYEYGTTMYGVSFTFVSIAIIAIIYTTLFKIRILPTIAIYKEWKKRIKNPDSIEVKKDLTLLIESGGFSPYEINKVTSVTTTKEFSFEVTIKGNTFLNGRTIEQTYPMLTIMKNQETLNQLFMLNMHIERTRLYRNETLKRILQMQIKDRNHLFIQELIDSQFFIAAYLYEEEHQDVATFDLSDSIKLAYHMFNGDICIYTDTEEISEETKKYYPLGYLLSFQQITSLILENNSILFTSSNGITLNPNSANIRVTYEQITKLSQLGGQNNGNNRH